MSAAKGPKHEPAAFARRFSLEATRPNAKEISALAEILPPGTPLYLTAVPTQQARELVTAAAGVRKAGLEPVAHVAARRLASPAALRELLAGLRSEADMRRVLLIGGDVDAPQIFADALAVIQKGHLREAGIEEIGIGAYPEAHPRIPAGRLEAALDEKIAAATAHGLRVHIVSQFSFSPERILAWLKQLRACGIAKPVKIGMAGPTSVSALLRFAKRCGVTASLRGLASGLATGLVGQVGPDRIVETLSMASGLGDVAPHYFSFGGTLETARYACQAASGRPGASRAMARSN
ncbi:MAG TPA: methylenetetrahydrofolate reductase [Pseudolabrys sp.]|jgi:methylenetetrahydrofolate reductase (NADPH)|nr:methylenetetrahydrofolate reductase [Pseudolabrys sp.]